MTLSCWKYKATSQLQQKYQIIITQSVQKFVVTQFVCPETWRTFSHNFNQLKQNLHNSWKSVLLLKSCKAWEKTWTLTWDKYSRGTFWICISKQKIYLKPHVEITSGRCTSVPVTKQINNWSNIMNFSPVTKIY